MHHERQRAEPRTKIFPHGELHRVSNNTWQVEGSQGMPLKRNMTVHRLADGRLVLYSVVALDEPGMRALEALGTPWLMIVPGSHTLAARSDLVSVLGSHGPALTSEVPAALRDAAARV